MVVNWSLVEGRDVLDKSVTRLELDKGVYIKSR